MMRKFLPLLLLLVGTILAGVWVEDTMFRFGAAPLKGVFVLGPGVDTSPTVTLTHYTWTQVWVYGLIDTLPQHEERGHPAVQLQWRWGTHDAYHPNIWHYSDWRQALPCYWNWPGFFFDGHIDSMIVYDSLYLSPLFDPDVPLAWVNRVQFRAISFASSDSCRLRFWTRRRMGAEAGDVLQWPYIPWGAP